MEIFDTIKNGLVDAYNYVFSDETTTPVETKTADTTAATSANTLADDNRKLSVLQSGNYCAEVTVGGTTRCF